jgi:hypothetical protein
MATNIEEIKGFLDEAKLKYKDYPGKSFLRTGYQTEKYIDTDGDHYVGIVISIEEDGEFVKVVVPKAYKFDKDLSSFNKMALFQTLLQISHMTKMMQFEYDVDDGEIWAIIEFPLEDALLTKNQLIRCIRSITGILEEYHEMITDAINHGITPESESEQRKAFEEFQRSRRQQRRDEFGNL